MLDRSGLRDGYWVGILDALREHPGKWANLGEHRRAATSDINTGRIGHCKRGEFEATCRGEDRATGKGTLYVRYVGPEP